MSRDLWKDVLRLSENSQETLEKMSREFRKKVLFIDMDSLIMKKVESTFNDACIATKK